MTNANLAQWSDDAWRLVRVFECLDGGGRQEILRRATELALLGLHRQGEAGAGILESEEAVEAIQDIVWSLWPEDWPGRNLVELDDLGDPGHFMLEWLAEGLIDYLLGSSDEDGEAAEWLAALYTEEVVKSGNPELPTAHGLTEDEMESAFQSDFRAFIQEWRGRIGREIESRCNTD